MSNIKGENDEYGTRLASIDYKLNHSQDKTFVIDTIEAKPEGKKFLTKLKYYSLCITTIHFEQRSPDQ